MSSSIRKIVLFLVVVATITLLCLSSSPTLAAPARIYVTDVSTVTDGSSIIVKRYPTCFEDQCQTNCIKKKGKSGACQEFVCVCADY
ncbi:MAG: hypothetical protein J3R72DRAFT_438631 [Linnemannia gamsii]|nr:MAG: hypothetical protein J3R72DRAFT_438631 [Linnemannia gamsii]